MKQIIPILALIGYAACAPAETSSQSSIAPKKSEITLASVLMDQTNGCMDGPMAQFGRYVGDWDIKDESLSKSDGKTWEEGKGARWNFTCVGDGIAVQDFWMPNGGGKGTNLRIYNPETESWDIVWTATGAPGTTRINAKANEKGDLVMSFVSPEQNPPRRIIFFSPSENQWDWSMQMDLGSNGTWTDVYKIKASRR